ncbi:MAG: helix-turn-helix transcriptional regulator [Oligoflexia bacterium]|nr:helix-turn-helix transcriptional regulator [Oligoflexia bacterium]
MSDFNFSKRLNKILTEKRLSQKYIAKKIGCSISTVNGWTAGCVPRDLKKLYELSVLLDVDFQYLAVGIEAGNCKAFNLNGIYQIIPYQK